MDTPFNLKELSTTEEEEPKTQLEYIPFQELNVVPKQTQLQHFDSFPLEDNEDHLDLNIYNCPNESMKMVKGFKKLNNQLDEIQKAENLKRKISFMTDDKRSKPVEDSELYYETVNNVFNIPIDQQQYNNLISVNPIQPMSENHETILSLYSQLINDFPHYSNKQIKAFLHSVSGDPWLARIVISNGIFYIMKGGFEGLGNELMKWSYSKYFLSLF